MPLLDPLLHTLSGVEDRPGNRLAMWYSRLFCGWPLKLEKGAKIWLVGDTEWLKDKPTWLSLGQGWFAPTHPPRHS